MSKKKRLLSKLILLLFVFTWVSTALFSTQAAADKMLTVNGGFQNDYAGWTLGGVKATWQPEGAWGTKGSVFVDVTNGYNDISQSLTFEKGKYYYITVSLKLAQVNEAYTTTDSQILISYKNGTEYLATGTKINSDGWTRLETLYSCSADETSTKFGSGKFYVRIGPAPQNSYSFDYYIDEFHCVELDSSNLVRNGDFRYKTLGWSSTNCSAALVDSGAQGTAQSARVTVTGKNQNARYYQNIAFLPNTYYKISLWIKLEAGQSQNAQILISHTNASGGDTGTEYLAQNTPVNDQWKNITVYYQYNTSSPGRTGPSGVGDFYVRIGDSSTENVNYYLDEVQVTKMAPENVVNGEFLDKGVWSYSGVGESSLVSDTPTGTANALKLVMSSPGGTVSQPVTLSQGVSYTMSFWAKGSGTPFEITPVIVDDVDGKVPLSQAFAIDGSSWTHCTLAYTPPKEFKDRALSFVFSDDTLQTYYLDEIELYKSAPKLENLAVSGELFSGDTIWATYDFPNTPTGVVEGASVYQWSYNSGLVWTTIASGTTTAGEGVSFVVPEDCLNSNLKLEVTPVDANGVSGQTMTKYLGTVKLRFEVDVKLQGTVVPNGQIKPVITIKNNTSDSKALTAFFAVYDQNGSMTELTADQQQIASAQQGSFSFQPVTLPAVVSGYTARVMIWESGSYRITNMKVFAQPLSAAEGS